MWKHGVPGPFSPSCPFPGYILLCSLASEVSGSPPSALAEGLLGRAGSPGCRLQGSVSSPGPEQLTGHLLSVKHQWGDFVQLPDFHSCTAGWWRVYLPQLGMCGQGGRPVEAHPRTGRRGGRGLCSEAFGVQRRL